MHSERADGFTLLELMVVLAILAAVGGVAAFGFDAVIGRDRDRPLHAVLTVLEQARDHAVIHGRRVCVRPGRDGRLRIMDTSGARDTFLELDRAHAGALVVPATPACFGPTGTAEAVRWSWVESGDTTEIIVEPWDGSASIH